MIKFTQGNLLEAKVEALINTVNTVGVMGKGIALMFKDKFPDNMRAYAQACKSKEVVIGRMFVTERHDWVGGPRWIINFPTKNHWRKPSKIEWIEEGLEDLKRFLIEKGVRSVAVPPLGSGNGGLDWHEVRPLIERALSPLDAVDVVVYEPTTTYQNVAKARGIEKLTPARAMVADLVRRYSVIGFECTLLEIQKLAYLLEKKVFALGLDNPLKLEFHADKFGPYAPKLKHLLDGLDGSYLHCEKRVADAGPLDIIWFEDSKREKVDLYLRSEAKQFMPALEAVTDEIDGFESPVGMELLATVDWLLVREKVSPSVDGIMVGLRHWLGGGQAAERKLAIFDETLIGLALQRLARGDGQSNANGA